ncbi:hypothetical protein M885DRAFT_498359 [Pelagophyceae sp. CCMP2097]|nr:hypothetical protein M885DRAFT_498359 [Pelagophyceae sp. CCMP2097]
MPPPVPAAGRDALVLASLARLLGAQSSAAARRTRRKWRLRCDGSKLEPSKLPAAAVQALKEWCSGDLDDVCASIVVEAAYDGGQAVSARPADEDALLLAAALPLSAFYGRESRSWVQRTVFDGGAEAAIRFVIELCVKDALLLAGDAASDEAELESCAWKLTAEQINCTLDRLLCSRRAGESDGNGRDWRLRIAVLRQLVLSCCAAVCDAEAETAQVLTDLMEAIQQRRHTKSVLESAVLKLRGSTDLDILGLAEAPNGDEKGMQALKRAYHKKARTAHPDKGGDPAQFRKIQEAYARLQKKHKGFSRGSKKQRKAARARESEQMDDDAPKDDDDDAPKDDDDDAPKDDDDDAPKDDDDDAPKDDDDDAPKDDDDDDEDEAWKKATEEDEAAEDDSPAVDADDTADDDAAVDADLDDDAALDAAVDAALGAVADDAATDDAAAGAEAPASTASFINDPVPVPDVFEDPLVSAAARASSGASVINRLAQLAMLWARTVDDVVPPVTPEEAVAVRALARSKIETANVAHDGPSSPLIMAIGQLVSSSSIFLQAGVGDSAAVEASACVSAALDAAREAGRGDVSALRAACALVDYGENSLQGSSRDVCAALDLAMASRDSAAATLLCAKQATMAAQRLEFSLEQRQRRQMPTEVEESDTSDEDEESKPEKPPPPQAPDSVSQTPAAPQRTFEDLRRDAQTLLARLDVDIDDLRSQVLCRANPEPKHVRALEAWVAAALDRTLLDLRRRLRPPRGEDVDSAVKRATSAVNRATSWLLDNADAGLTPTQALDARAFSVSCALSPATPRALVSALRDRLAAAAGASAVAFVDSRCDEVMRHIDDVAAQHELKKARHAANDD